MEAGGDAVEALQEGLGGGVEVFVGDAEDAATLDGAKVVPAALLDDAGEGDSIAGSAPGEEENVGVGCGDGLGCGVCSRSADEGATGGGDELGDPGLGMDDGFAPLFAVDGGVGEVGGLSAGVVEGRGEGLDEGFALGACVGKLGEDADVGEDGSEVVRG